MPSDASPWPGAASGAVTGAMLCTEGESKWACAGIGALAGAAAGATFGAASALGAGAITAGARSGGVGALIGDGATQLATTGTIDLPHVDPKWIV